MEAMGVNLLCAERRMGLQVSCHLRCILVGFLSTCPLGFPLPSLPGTEYAACRGKCGTSRGKLNRNQNPYWRSGGEGGEVQKTGTKEDECKYASNN